MAEDKTTHRFEAEVEQVLRLVIESLYSNREVFLRELVSNAADALDKLRFRAVTEPDLREADELRIRLLPDSDARTLTIWDNGIGMTQEELVSHLGTVAKSGTRELAEKIKQAKTEGSLDVIGQFGVGFYSAYLVADRVEVVSRAAGNDEAFRWTSEGKESFTVEPAERDVHGTSVTLHLAKDHEGLLEPAVLRQLIQRYSDYLSWPIELRKAPKEGEEPTFEKVNRGTALWQRPKDQVEDAQYEELYHHLTGDWEKPLAWRHFKLEGTQEFAGIVFVPSRAPMALWNPDATHGMRLYVKRVFIMDDAEELLPRWLRFARGVVDSEDLPLNVSRELLQDSGVVRTIQKQVVKQILDLLKDLAENRPDDYAAFWRAFGAVIKEGLHTDPRQSKDLAPLLRFESSEAEGLTSLAEVKGRMKDGQEAIYYVIGDSRRQVEASPHIEGLKKKGFEVLYLTDPVDPFAMEALEAFDGVKLVSASDAGLEVGETDEGVGEERESELGDLRDRFRVRLQDEVSEVRLSTRLTDSPVCLVTPPGGVQPHVERLLRAAQQDLPKQKRILELNPEHPVVENLRRLLERGERARVDEWIALLHDQARIAEGSPIEDPAAFNRRLTALLKDASERMIPTD